MNKDYFLKRLSFRHPSLLEKNSYDLLPEKFLATDKIPLECRVHGVFYQKAYTHLAGRGCLLCGQNDSRNNRALTTEEFIEKSRKRFGDRFNYAKTNYRRQNENIVLTCKSHGDFEIKPWSHFQNKFGCPRCSVEIPTEIKKNKFLAIAKKVHGGLYDYSKVKYTTVSSPVEIVCLKHGPFFQNLYNHSKLGAKCPVCSIEASKLTLEVFIERSVKIHGPRYDYSKVRIETNASKVLITCPKHGDWVQRVASHLAGNKCKECFIEENRSTTEEFIKNARKVHGDTYDYSKAKYINNKKPLEIICKIHGSFWIKPNSHVSSASGCRFCYESKGEREVESVLKKYGLNFVREYRILPYFYRYDFFLPEFNIFIEFNGEQHYRAIEHFGGEKAFLETVERDRRKKELVKQVSGYLVTLTYANRCSGTVEKGLIRDLRKLYRYWYSVDGIVRAFKNISEVCIFFQFREMYSLSELRNAIEKTGKNVKFLF